MKSTSGLCLAAKAVSTYAAINATSNGQPILIDTDIMSGVDDIGALAVANVLHNCGLADVRGIAIKTHSHYGALAASVICTCFGNGDIPIAIIRPLTNESFFDEYSYTLGEYASKVAYKYPRALVDTETTPTPVDLYRSVLSAAADDSVRLISNGFLTNLADLLRSEADHHSSLSGIGLISAKVSELIVVGAYYPEGWEFNFGGEDQESTIYVINHWPSDVPITYSGSELGENIFSGQRLAQESPPDSSVFAAYQSYVGRCSTVRESWDPLTVLYGVLGLEGFSKIGIKPPSAFANHYGRNSITSNNASNAWINDISVTNQHWLRLADGVTNSSVAWLLDEFYVRDPIVQHCF